MRSFPFLVVCWIVSVCGCGGDSSPPPASDSSAPPAASDAAPSAPSVPAAGSSAPVGNLSPEATVRQAISAVGEGRLELLWDLLPPSYQKDLNDIVREFGKSVDAETWDSLMRTSNRYLSVSLAKQSMMMQTPDFKNLTRGLSSLGQVPGAPPVDFSRPELLEPAIKSSLEAALGLLNSDISTAKALQTFDGRKYFASGINVFYKGLLQMIESFVKGLAQDPMIANSPMAAELNQFDLKKELSNIKISGDRKSVV